MAITFGSFGDVIAAVQVAYKLLEILNAQRGAKREFHDLIVDLRLFHRFLDQLLSFWQTREQGPFLDNLHDILQPVICDAKGEISEFLENIISKYGRNLASPSKRNPKDVGKMVLWHVLERDGINRLQDKLRKSKEVILMVQSQANMIAEERNRELVSEKMSALMDVENEISTKLDQRLENLEELIEGQKNTLHRIENGIGSVASAVIPIADATSNVQTMLADVYTELLAQRTLSVSLNPYAQNSALIEDALGWTFSIPLELNISWKTFHSILLDRFEGRPGYHLIKKGRYVLRDDLNGIELRQNTPLTMVLRPSQKVNMCMVYFSADKHLMVCPRCKKSSLRVDDTEITCLNLKCGMEIQRIEEILDTEKLEDRLGTKKASIFARDDEEPTSQIDFEDEVPPTELIPASGREDAPAIFKRIRYISSWEYRDESRGALRYKTGQNRWWGAYGFEAIMMRRALALSLCNSPDPDCNWDEVSYYSLYFVGTSVQQSRPVFIIFARDKKLRQQLGERCREIDWVKAHPSLLLITSWSSLFHERIKGWWNDYVEEERRRRYQ